MPKNIKISLDTKPKRKCVRCNSPIRFGHGYYAVADITVCFNCMKTIKRDKN